MAEEIFLLFLDIFDNLCKWAADSESLEVPKYVHDAFGKMKVDLRRYLQSLTIV